MVPWLARWQDSLAENTDTLYRGAWIVCWKAVSLWDYIQSHGQHQLVFRPTWSIADVLPLCTCVRTYSLWAKSQWVLRPDNSHEAPTSYGCSDVDMLVMADMAMEPWYLKCLLVDTMLRMLSAHQLHDHLDEYHIKCASLPAMSASIQSHQIHHFLLSQRIRSSQSYLTATVINSIRSLKMKSFSIAAAVALLAPFVQCQNLIIIFFEGADFDTSYFPSFPLDGCIHNIAPRMSLRKFYIPLVSIILFDPPCSHSSYACKIALVWISLTINLANSLSVSQVRSFSEVGKCTLYGS